MGKRKSYIKKRTGGNLFVAAAPAAAAPAAAAPAAPTAAPAAALPGVSGLIGKFNDLAAKGKNVLGDGETALKASHEKLSKGVNDAIDAQKNKLKEARNSIGKLVSGADVPEPSPQAGPLNVLGPKPAAGGRRRRKTRRTRKVKKSKKGRKSMKRRHTKRRR